MSKMQALFAMAAMMAVPSCEMMYGEPHHYSQPTKPKKLTEEEKWRIHQEMENRYHIYNINGVEIKARNKKDAKKIYSRKYKK